MYETRHGLNEPPDRATLWRYMGLDKFVSLLEQKSLFFTRITKLQDDDPDEGRMPSGARDAIERNPHAFVGQPKISREEAVKVSLRDVESNRATICASCWTASPKESRYMWTHYPNGGQGIAIRTTFSRFRKAFGATDEYVFGGKIRYEATSVGTRVDIGQWVTVKRGRFEHENEFRALTFDSSGCTCGPGILVPIDVKTLLQEVRVSPMANDRLDVVQELVRCYGLTCLVMKSGLHPPEQE
jgi:hypothetical protein